MLDRQAVGAMLEKLRAARVAGDTETLLTFFSDTATFCINGYGVPASGKTAVGEALRGLVEDFEFLEWRPIKTFVDGNDMSIRAALKVRNRRSGKTVETEISDFLTIEDGKVAAYFQFIDTALAASLAGTDAKP